MEKTQAFPVIGGQTTFLPKAGKLQERRFFVDKIVLVAAHPRQYEGVIACLCQLFPECEIQIVSKEGKVIECLPITPEPDKSEEQRDKEE